MCCDFLSWWPKFLFFWNVTMTQIHDWWGTVLGGWQSRWASLLACPHQDTIRGQGDIWSEKVHNFFILMHSCCWVGGTVNVDWLHISLVSVSPQHCRKYFCCWLKSLVSNNIQHRCSCSARLWQWCNCHINCWIFCIWLLLLLINCVWLVIIIAGVSTSLPKTALIRHRGYVVLVTIYLLWW